MIVAYTGTPVVSTSGGSLRVEAAQVSRGPYAAGQAIEFRATFQDGNPYQAVGFNNQSAFKFVLFGMDDGGHHLMTWTNGVTSQLPDSLLGGPHDYRIEWTANSEKFFVDGALVHTDSVAIVDALAVNAEDWGANGGPLLVDSVHLMPYANTSTFSSRLLDAGSTANWATSTWTADTPAGTRRRRPAMSSDCWKV